MDSLAAGPRCLAFYLPQYYPTPENDEWWAPGFTDWVNVAKQRPRFIGHHQPHIPRELGYYDLRLAETRIAQAALGKRFGIDGFVYYHYWFSGRRVLGDPLDHLLISKEPDYPFCLCWANESWNRTWGPTAGRPVLTSAERSLIVQRYDEADDREHIRWLSRVFEDPRYVRVRGRPLLLVWRTNSLPNARRTADVWREEAARIGIGEIYLCRVESSGARIDPREIGFDASVVFQPTRSSLSNRVGGQLRSDGISLRARQHHVGLLSNRVYRYTDVIRKAVRMSHRGYPNFPCVIPGWDNSARRPQRATIVIGSTPLLYGEWLATAVDSVRSNGCVDGLVFVNAWNEWAEGCHLEPDQHWGLAYLEAHAIGRRGRAALSGYPVRPETE